MNHQQFVWLLHEAVHLGPVSGRNPRTHAWSRPIARLPTAIAIRRNKRNHRSRGQRCCCFCQVEFPHNVQRRDVVTVFISRYFPRALRIALTSSRALPPRYCVGKVGGGIPGSGFGLGLGFCFGVGGASGIGGSGICGSGIWVLIAVLPDCRTSLARPTAIALPSPPSPYVRRLTPRRPSSRGPFARRPSSSRPRWTAQNPPLLDTSNPAISGGDRDWWSFTLWPRPDASQCGPWCASSVVRT